MRLMINTTLPRHEVEYTWPRPNFELDVTEAQIETEGPVVQIDQRESRAELGFGDYRSFAVEKHQLAKNAALEAIARMAREGDRFINEMQRQDTISRIVVDRLNEKIPQLNLASAPQSRPEIEFHYKTEIQWEEGVALTDFITAPPKIRWQLGEVKVRVDKGQNYDQKG